mgnify:CR=1 FL=1
MVLNSYDNYTCFFASCIEKNSNIQRSAIRISVHGKKPASTGCVNAGFQNIAQKY